jgi:hypothetical protein
VIAADYVTVAAGIAAADIEAAVEVLVKAEEMELGRQVSFLVTVTACRGRFLPT